MTINCENFTENVTNYLNCYVFVDGFKDLQSFRLPIEYLIYKNIKTRFNIFKH